MRTPSSFVFGLSTLCCGAACGPPSPGSIDESTQTEDTGSSTSTGEQTSDEPPGDGDPGDGDGDPGDGDPGDGDGDPSTPGEQPCVALDVEPDAFIALIVGETAVYLLRHDGSTLALDTSLPDAEPDAELALAAGVGEGWVTIVSYDSVTVYDDEDIAPAHDLAHYRVWSQTTGELAWEHVEAATGSEPSPGPDPRVGIDGRVVLLVPFTGGDGTRGRVVGEQGVLGSFSNCIPESAVGPDDWHACVSFLEPQPRWANAPLDQSLGAPHVYSNFYWRYETLPDGSFRYVGDIDGVLGLMEARVDTFDFTPWPEAQPLFEHWQLRALNFAERWFVVHDAGQYQLLRHGEDAEPLDPPPDHPVLRHNRSERMLVDGDNMLLGWANDDAERVYVHEGAGPGEPFPGFVPISGHRNTYLGVTEGTYWLRTSGSDDDWGQPPPEALLGPTMQVHRPSADTTLAFEVFGFGSRFIPTLDDSGRCLARPVSEQPGAPWHINDLDNHTWFELPEPGRVLWL